MEVDPGPEDEALHLRTATRHTLNPSLRERACSHSELPVGGEQFLLAVPAGGLDQRVQPNGQDLGAGVLRFVLGPGNSSTSSTHVAGEGRRPLFFDLVFVQNSLLQVGMMEA